MIELTPPDPMGLPDISLTAQGNLAQTQLVTDANVAYVLRETGFRVRFNMMTGDMEYEHTSLTDPGQYAQAHMEMQILDMCARMRMKSRETVREILAVQAEASPFHPMEEWMQGLKWDGVDRIDALAASITTDNPLWPTYLENWMVQVVEGVCGWRDRQAKKSLPHVLVLVGAQGVGKSQWLKALGGAWFKGEAELHLSSFSGKDHQVAALRYPMVELSELDGIFRKADISHLKSFISREEDSIRLPYARRAMVRPRMTSFCGSVNDAQFLNDGTGSRRFWPVQVEAIDWSVRVDVEQLWAQAYTFWQEDSNFNLTAQDDALREQIATDEHFTESDESEMVREYLRLHSGNPAFEIVPMSTLDVLQMLKGKHHNFNNKQKADANRALCDMYGKHRTIDGKQRCWRVPRNEFATDRASWPDNITRLSLVSDTQEPRR